MAICFFSQSETHRELSSFAPRSALRTSSNPRVGREGAGQNRLGKIIERIRAELRAQAS
jgi:hypothetical protein